MIIEKNFLRMSDLPLKIFSKLKKNLFAQMPKKGKILKDPLIGLFKKITFDFGGKPRNELSFRIKVELFQNRILLPDEVIHFLLQLITYFVLFPQSL